MSNEQLLLEIGRMMGKTVQESEERMKSYVREIVHEAIQSSESRTHAKIERVSKQIRDVDRRLSTEIQSLRETVQHAMDDTEKMAQQIAAGLK